MYIRESFTPDMLNEAWRTSDKPIANYVILEDFADSDTLHNATTEIKKDAVTGKPVGHAVFQSGGVRNRNGRIYLTEDLDREIHCPRTLELLRTKNLFSEAGHPIDTSLQRQSTIDWRNSNCKILTLEMNGNNVEGTFTPSNTELGKAFEQDLREGMIPAFSLRALGSIRQTRLGAQVTDLRLITYDQVIYPSHSNAYMTGLVNESASPESILQEQVIFESFDKATKEKMGSNRIIPTNPLNEKEINSIKEFVTYNSNNFKYINDYFGTNFKNITISPNGSKIILKETGTDNLIEVNLEAYIHNELMNYSEKIKDLYK